MVAVLLFGIASLAAGADSDALFPIRAGRQFGFIDRTGKVVIAPRFDRVSEFREGLAAVWSGAAGGYIDRTGRLVIPAQYTTASDFEERRALVSKDGKYNVIDTAGKTVAEIPYRVLGDYSAGLAVVQRARSGSIPSAYRPSAYGYIDRNGKVVIEPRFMPAGKFPADGTGLAVAGLDRHWCYIDRTGKIILRLPMEGRDRADGFHDGLLRWKEGFYWGYKGANGEWAIEPRFDDATDFNDGRARVEQKGKWMWIDARGKKVDEGKGPRRTGPFAEGLALAVDSDLFGYLKPDGRSAFAFRKYDEAHDFSCGLARIKLDGKYGYLDREGRLAIANQFHGAADFKNCLASVGTSDGFGYIDPKGKMIWKSESQFQ